MSSTNVKSLLFITSMDEVYPRSFFFHCAQYWAKQGLKVLYITHEPMQNLPYSIGKPKTTQNLESFSLIQFMYLPKRQDLLKQCYSIHLQQNPASVIIVHGLEKYFAPDGDNDSDHVSQVCASLLQAASVSATKNSRHTYLISGFNSGNDTIPGIMCKSFFHNVVHLTKEDKIIEPRNRELLLLKLSKLNQAPGNPVVVFFLEDKRFLNYDSAFDRIVKEYK